MSEIIGMACLKFRQQSFLLTSGLWLVLHTPAQLRLRSQRKVSAHAAASCLQSACCGGLVWPHLKSAADCALQQVLPGQTRRICLTVESSSDGHPHLKHWPPTPSSGN